MNNKYIHLTSTCFEQSFENHTNSGSGGRAGWSNILRVAGSSPGGQDTEPSRASATHWCVRMSECEGEATVKP